MNFFRYIFLSFLFTAVPLVSQAQVFSSPEKTANAFIRALNHGNFEKALSYCILELNEEMSRDFHRMDRRQERIMVDLYDCENVITEFGVDCECGTVFSGRTSILIFSMTEIDGSWKIYELDSKPVDREIKIREAKKKRVKPAKPMEYVSPVEMLQQFAGYNADQKFKKSEDMAIMGAKRDLLKQIETNPELLPVSLINVSCYESENEYRISCSCDQKTASGKEEAGYYDLVLIDGKWKILEFGNSVGAESVVTRFVNALARGNCEEAKKMSTGNASESVQGSIDAGCVSYHTEIVSVYCSYEEDSAYCSCTEKRDGMEMTFKYTLSQMGNRWFVSDYQKDFELDMEDGYVPAEALADSLEPAVEEYHQETPETAVVLPEVEASFPGGEVALDAFLAANMVYPPKYKEEGLSGTVYLMFIVLEDGTITEVAVARGTYEELNMEAVRLVKSMPKWVPGTVDGKNVASYYTLPIKFTASN